MVDSDERVIGVISLSDLLNFLVLRPVGFDNNNSILSPTSLVNNIKCSQVLEECAEEDCHSTTGLVGGMCSSTAVGILDDVVDASDDNNGDSLSSYMSDVNQLTTRSLDPSTLRKKNSFVDDDDGIEEEDLVETRGASKCEPDSAVPVAASQPAPLLQQT